MELIDAVQSVAIFLTYCTFFLGVPDLYSILSKKQTEAGQVIGFTIGLAMCTAWYHVGHHSPNPLSSAQVYGLLINGLCMLVFLLYTDDKFIVVKHIGAVLALHLSLTVFAAQIAPSPEWAAGGVFAFALTLNAAMAVLPLLSINDVKKHKCTYPMGMDLKSSSLLLCLTLAWGLHALLSGDLGSMLFNSILASSWAVVVYFNMVYPFNPPTGAKKKVPGLSLKRVTTSMKDFGDKMSNFTLEEFGGYGDDKTD